MVEPLTTREWGASRADGGKIDPPDAGGTGYGGCGLSGEGYSHPLARTVFAIDGDGGVALQNHVVAEHLGQKEAGLGRGGRVERPECEWTWTFFGVCVSCFYSGGTVFL